MAEYGLAIDADLGYNTTLARAEDAWRRFLAQAGLQSDFMEAEAERAKKLFKAREAKDIGKFADEMAGRQLFFSGVTARGIGDIQGEYNRIWADFLNDVANKYSSIATQGWDTNADLTKSIVDSAFDYLNNIQRLYF